MAFTLPDRDELKALAAELGPELDNDAADALLSYFAPFQDGFQYLETEAAELPPVRYPARNFQFPEPNENPLGAWYVKTELKGAAKGPLHGQRVAIKDSIFVADVPMMYGTSVLEGFKPDFDATVVTRLLDAGAEIAGKAVCEYLCLPAAASRPAPDSSATHTTLTTRPAVPHPEALRWSPVAPSTSRSAPIRLAPCASRPAGAARSA